MYLKWLWLMGMLSKFRKSTELKFTLLSVTNSQVYKQSCKVTVTLETVCFFHTWLTCKPFSILSKMLHKPLLFMESIIRALKNVLQVSIKSPHRYQLYPLGQISHWKGITWMRTNWRNLRQNRTNELQVNSPHSLSTTLQLLVKNWTF